MPVTALIAQLWSSQQHISVGISCEFCAELTISPANVSHSISPNDVYPAVVYASIYVPLTMSLFPKPPVFIRTGTNGCQSQCKWCDHACRRIAIPMQLLSIVMQGLTPDRWLLAVGSRS